jgi:hypothetical protein
VIAGPELPSSVDEQPPDGPAPRPPQRRRPPSKAELKAAQRRAALAARSRPTRQAAPARRRPAVTDDAGDAGDEPDAPARDPRQKRMVVLMTILTVIVVVGGGIAIGAAMNSRSGNNGPTGAFPDAPVPMTTFRDPPNGITLEYPRSWKKVEVPVAEYRLALDAGNSVAFTLRVVPIQTPATAQNLQNFKSVTDGLVASNPTVKVFKEQAITLNGMLGYYYFYTFEDGPVTAVHAHYFLFSGNKMNILVFQTLPDDFEPLAATFDKVAESFRSDPNIPPTSTVPASTTTTAR